MSSPPDYRRPNDPATSDRQLRNAFAAFDIDDLSSETQSDTGSPRSESPSRPLSNAKSLPTLPKTAYRSPENTRDYDNGVQPYWEPLFSETDEARRSRELVQHDESQTRSINTNETPQPVANFDEAFDAQAVYPAEACLFVANLPQNSDDLTIERELTKFFVEFGTVFIKVKRDQRFMPYAFAQFTEREHADLALKKAWGRSFMGRYLRLEKCGSNLAYIIFSKANRPVEYKVAQNIFSGHGKIAKIEPLDHNIQMKLNVPPSLLVQYEKYDPRRDVVKSFGFSNVYMIMPYDPKVGQDRSERPSGDKSFMEHYEKDRRSIFMGNLPLHADDILIHSLASLCGNVVSIDLRNTPHINGGHPNVYAFVEFSRPDAPDEAVRQFNGTSVEGSILRVERKRSKPTRDVRSLSQSLRPLPMAPPPLRPHRRGGSMAITPTHHQRNHSRMGSMTVAPNNQQINYQQVNSVAPAPATAVPIRHQADHRRMLSVGGLSPIPQDSPAMPLQNVQPNSRLGFISPSKAPVFNGTGLDEYTPIQSPDKAGVPNGAGNNVHWGPSRFVEASPIHVLSPTESSPDNHHLDDLHKRSFTDRVADRVATPGRSISYAFSPAAEHAADRCENAIEEKDGGAAKGHRRADSSLNPTAPVLELDVSDSDGSSDWRNTGTSEEEADLKKTKQTVRFKLRRGHLSEQNLKRNELYQQQFLKLHKSEEDLKSDKGSPKTVSKSPKSPPVEKTPPPTNSTVVSSRGGEPTQAQKQTQTLPAPPDGFVYVAVPEVTAAQLATPPVHGQNHQYAPPQAYHQYTQATYQTQDQVFHAESARTTYQTPSQAPFLENVQPPYQGYAQTPYIDRGAMHQIPPAQQQTFHQVDLHGRPHTTYTHPMGYRELPPARRYVSYNNMAPSNTGPMLLEAPESYHQMRQRIEAERYQRYNA